MVLGPQYTALRIVGLLLQVIHSQWEPIGAQISRVNNGSGTIASFLSFEVMQISSHDCNFAHYNGADMALPKSAYIAHEWFTLAPHQGTIHYGAFCKDAPIVMTI